MYAYRNAVACSRNHRHREKSKKYYIILFMCARADEWVRMRVAFLTHHATRMRHIVLSFVASGSTTFFDIISQPERFTEKSYKT